MANRGSCRICHSIEDLDSTGKLTPHENKYYKQRCLGEFRLPIEGTVVPPKDYAPYIPKPGEWIEVDNPEWDEPVIPTPLVILATALAIAVVVVVWWL